MYVTNRTRTYTELHTCSRHVRACPDSSAHSLASGKTRDDTRGRVHTRVRKYTRLRGRACPNRPGKFSFFTKYVMGRVGGSCGARVPLLNFACVRLRPRARRRSRGQRNRIHVRLKFLTEFLIRRAPFLRPKIRARLPRLLSAAGFFPPPRGIIRRRSLRRDFTVAGTAADS